MSQFLTTPRTELLQRLVLGQLAQTFDRVYVALLVKRTRTHSKSLKNKKTRFISNLTKLRRFSVLQITAKPRLPLFKDVFFRNKLQKEILEEEKKLWLPLCQKYAAALKDAKQRHNFIAHPVQVPCKCTSKARIERKRRIRCCLVQKLVLDYE